MLRPLNGEFAYPVITMTKSIISFALMLCCCGASVDACTSLIAAKGATTDGSVMITYAADSHTLYGSLCRRAAADHRTGEMRAITDWDSGKPLGEIEEVSHTYATIGNMNECGVAIAESTFGGRPELQGSGMIDYGSLIYIALERARTAREAIGVMTSLVERYGYASEGESFSIADANEAWIMELIGKGSDDKGAVWVARRVPDGYISGHANHSRIHQFPLDDPETLYAPDVIDFARSKGYYHGLDSLFSFSRAYAVYDALALRGCDARVWAYYSKFAPEGTMSRYQAWVLRGEGDPLPLWVKPKAPLDANDLKWMMRDHFEGTCLDMTLDVGAGPFKVPYRWRPMEYTVDGVTYAHERAIATQQTGFSFVADLNANRHPAMKGILWFGVDDANTCVYVPIFSSTDTVPHSLDAATADLYTLNRESMFWVNNIVANQAYNRYSAMIGDIRKVQGELEAKAEADVDAAATAVAALDYDAAQTLLNDLAVNTAENVTARYRELGEYLLVKYLDGNIKREADGRFLRNEWGVPEQPVFGGYDDERYFRAIVDDAGERLKVVEPAL